MAHTLLLLFVFFSSLLPCQDRLILPMSRLDDSGLEALKVLIKSKAPNIIAEYEKSGTISTKNRMLLVRVAVSNLVERRGL